MLNLIAVWFYFFTLDFLFVLGFMQLSGSNFLRSSGSSRRGVISSNRDVVLTGSEADPSRPDTTDANPGAFRKISSGQRSSPVISSEHRPSSGRNASNIKNFESTLRGIETLHFNSDERVQY
jgi:casein kinase 1